MPCILQSQLEKNRVKLQVNKYERSKNSHLLPYLQFRGLSVRQVYDNAKYLDFSFLIF